MEHQIQKSYFYFFHLTGAAAATTVISTDCMDL